VKPRKTTTTTTTTTTTNQTPPSLAKVILAGERRREKLRVAEDRLRAAGGVDGVQAGEEEEGSQSVGRQRAKGGGGGARPAAEHCTLQQTGTQWPLDHTGWQGLQSKEDGNDEEEKKRGKRGTKKRAILPRPDPVEHEPVECFQTPGLKMSKYAV